MTADRVTGKPIRRVEDPRFLTGRGSYVDDVQPEGLVHLAFARSPYACAKVTRINVDQAKTARGVIAVATGDDVPELGDVPVLPLPFAKVAPHPPLARGRAASMGFPIVAIVAESVGEALDAVDLVEIEYEPEPSVASAEDALQPGAPRVHPQLDSNVCYALKKEGGDVERAFREAEVTVQVRVESPRVAPICMETRGVVAVPGTSPRLTVWASSQAPHGLRADLAKVLRIKPPNVRVIAPDVGGGFGAKSGATPEYIMACYFALKLGRPVKWVATRSEDVLATTQGRDMVMHVEVAAKRDGSITGLKLRNVANMGAQLHSASAVTASFMLSMASGCYRIPNISVESTAVFTNTPSTGPYRGAGRPETVLAIERGIDRLAAELGMDPIELRRTNFISPDQFPFTTASGAEYDSGDYAAALTHALELLGYPELVHERDAARASGQLMGIGVSTFVEPAGSVGGESGLVQLERDGKVTLITGSHGHGQGHETSFAQVVADQMNVRFEDVRVIHGDTAAIEQGVGTFASRSMMLGGGAAVQAATQVVEKARQVAARQLEATVDDVVPVDGGFSVAGAPARRVSWKEIAEAAPEQLEAREVFDPKRESWPFGTHLAVVRVDRETGRVNLERIVAVDDCGNVVNPLIVEGQVHGGIAQAVGQSMVERVVYSDDGQLLSGSLGDYAVPRATDIPPMVLGHTVTPTPLNPLGAKGVGEAGTNGCPPAIANAVVDALSPLGVRHLDVPFTADRVWEAIRAAGG